MTHNNTQLPLAPRRTRASWILAGLAGPFLLSGCTETVVVPECGVLVPPAQVYSVTGDEEVWLYWTPVQPDKVVEYVVYRSFADQGPYEEIGHTRGDTFVDRQVVNGATYFYAVTSLDNCGFESELSPESVFDTPRPEGYGAQVFDANSSRWERSGWDFSTFRSLPWDHPDTDVYFIWADGVPLIVGQDVDTDVQDAGFVGFDAVGWAPDGGWSPTGTAEAISGHCYLVWTRDNHFAKVRVLAVRDDRITFDWGYQVDRGNPELAPRPGFPRIPMGVTPDGAGVPRPVPRPLP